METGQRKIKIQAAFFWDRSNKESQEGWELKPKVSQQEIKTKGPGPKHPFSGLGVAAFEPHGLSSVEVAKFVGRPLIVSLSPSSATLSSRL